MIAIDFLKDLIKLRAEIDRLISRYGQLQDQSNVPIANNLYEMKRELQKAIEELTAKITG